MTVPREGQTWYVIAKILLVEKRICGCGKHYEVPSGLRLKVSNARGTTLTMKPEEVGKWDEKFSLPVLHSYVETHTHFCMSCMPEVSGVNKDMFRRVLTPEEAIKWKLFDEAQIRVVEKTKIPTGKKKRTTGVKKPKVKPLSSMKEFDLI